MSQSAFHANISAPALRDAAPLSWPAQFSYQPSGSDSDDPSVQPHWDDFVSSLQPAPARISPMGSGAGDFFNDGYGLDLHLVRDEYTSSRSSAPPSSVPDDDGWSSRSSGRVRAPKAGVGATTSNVTAPTANDVGPALGATAALPMPMSSEFLTSAPTAAEGGSDVADVRRLSARKRTQADLSGTARVSSNKRQKKLEDPLAGWVMQDPDTGEKLTGHEWVERNPEEFAQRYKKDHQRYLQYLAQSVDS
ncbi:hypothetical protein FB451DRAFT_1235727 [Mycena latifolia]|nr:hypothetical protein FB451DRAFT_1235727 [Mycena latifolia]